jgi:hypothetical protein
MIMDCTNHSAERAFAEGNFEAIEEYLSELEGYERRGCGIRVFRGRTLMVLGDARHKERRYNDAYAAWRDGLSIVARYGNSRSNVELFDDILHSRREKLIDVVADLGYEETLRAQWTDAGLASAFPAIIEICNEAIEREGL